MCIRDRINDIETLDWIKSIHKSTTFTISICSGSILLGILRLLDEKPYCTHNEVYNFMKKIVANGKPNPKKRYIKEIVKKLLPEATVIEGMCDGAKPIQRVPWLN